MSFIKEYDYKHHYDSPKEPGWYLTNTEWQATKYKATGELSPLAKRAMTNPKGLTVSQLTDVERENPNVHFPHQDWDGEDFN